MKPEKKKVPEKQSIDIISSFKPVLRSNVKINLTATNLSADSSKPSFKYNIPAQNLFYSYAPIPIKPLALDHDTVLLLGNRDFIKAGFGNYTTPYLNAGFSFGNGKKNLLTVTGGYIASKGKIQYQDYQQAAVKVADNYFGNTNEYYGFIEGNRNDYNLYGYDHSLHSYPSDSVSRYYQNFRFKAGIRNIVPNPGGFDYDPTIDVNYFTGKNNLVETGLLVNAPVTKKLTDDIFLKITGVADITNYKADSSAAVHVLFDNNVFQIAPEVIIQKENYIAHIGVSPTWDNNNVSVLPNIYGELHIRKQLFLVQAGVVGTVTRNNFSNLSVINPYLQVITATNNTRAIEIYGGLKSAISKHFSASGKLSYINYKNLPLFINDTLDGKTFYISNEPKLNDIRLHFDASYINQDKFTVTGGVTFDQYSNLTTNARAWGMLPIEFNTSIRWEAFKDVVFKGDLYIFGKPQFLLNNNIIKTGSGGADLNIGTEIAITKHINGWLDINNLFNNKYQRWNNYPVYGLNVLGGIVYRFN
jgi:hypothetical protein